jgi:hypothetical protein
MWSAHALACGMGAHAATRTEGTRLHVVVRRLEAAQEVCEEMVSEDAPQAAEVRHAPLDCASQLPAMRWFCWFCA